MIKSAPDKRRDSVAPPADRRVVGFFSVACAGFKLARGKNFGKGGKQLVVGRFLPFARMDQQRQHLAALRGNGLPATRQTR